MDQFMSNVELATSFNLDIIIVGDLNINCHSNNYIGNAVYNLCNLFDMEQLISVPTRVTATSQTVIDVIITSMSSKHVNTGVIQTTLSDHYMIFTDLCCSVKVTHHSREIKCRSFKYFNKDRFLDDVYHFVHSLNYGYNLETLWDYFKTGFTRICNEHAPMRSFRVKGDSKPWITHDIIKMMRKRDRIHKEAVVTNNINAFDEYRKSRNAITQEIHNEKMKYFKERIGGNNNSQQMWKSVKMILGNSKTSEIPLDISCDELNYYFTNIGSNLNEPDKTDTFHWQGSESIYEFKFRNITETEVCKYISKFPCISNSDILGFDV